MGRCDNRRCYKGKSIAVDWHEKGGIHRRVPCRSWIYAPQKKTGPSAADRKRQKLGLHKKRNGTAELQKRTGNLTSTIEMPLSWHYGFWTVKTRWCVVSTGASSSPHLCHSLLIIKPKENYSLCSEWKTTKENFFPKPPQTCDFLWVARSSSRRLLSYCIVIYNNAMFI